MFFLSVLFLVVLAGLIHRYPRLAAHDVEAYLIEGGLAVLWVLFVLEAVLRFRLRDRERPVWKALLAALAVALVPPLRMGCGSQVRPDHLWLPRVGWQPINRHLSQTLERFFSIPMICFALLVLPLLALEHWKAARIRDEPILALWLDIGTSVIWLAFAIELILMVAVSDRPWHYCFFHWIDVTIVLLPLVEVLPMFRLLRLGRILRLEELLRAGQLYRLQALVLRGWRAFLLLQIIQRLTRRSPERRLEELQDLVRAKEEELAELRGEIRGLEATIAQKARCRTPAEPLPRRGVEREKDGIRLAHGADSVFVEAP
jgi:hypothetical protein